MQFVSNELVREFTSVYERWPDCLNQDLLDFLDFQDMVRLLARMWLDERLREFARVCESLRELGGLSESGFAGFFGFSGCGLSRGADVVGRAYTRVCESLRDCLNQDLLDFLDFQDAACLAVRMWLDERLREMYECLREFAGCLDCSFVICVMGCDLSLAGAWVLVPLSARVVRELYEPLHGGSCFGGNMAEIAEMAEKLGRSGYNFFRGPCCRYVFASVFPIPESVPGSGNLSTSLNFDRLMPVCWRRGAVRRVWKGHVGLGRVRAGSLPILDFGA